MGRIATILAAASVSLGGCAPPDARLPIAPRLAEAPRIGSPLAFGGVSESEPIGLFAALPAAPGGAAAARSGRPRRAPLRVRMSAVARGAMGDDLEPVFESANLDVDLQIDPSSDRGGIEHVILEQADCALVAAGPSPSEMSQGARGLLLGHRVLAVVVHPRNPMRSILADNLRNLLTGQTKDWQSITYLRGEVALYLPPEGPMADHAASSLIRGDPFDRSAHQLASPRDVLERVAGDPMGLGVVPLTALRGIAEGPRPLWIEGAEPSARAFAAERYPFGTSIYLVHGARPCDEVATLAEFFESETGGAFLHRRLHTP